MLIYCVTKERLLMRRVSDFMSKDLYALRSYDSMQKASDDMKSHCVRHIVITDNDKLLGILSDLDIKKWEACRVIDPSQAHWSVSQCMTKNVHTLKVYDSLLDAIEWLALGHYHALPVENESGELTGIITTTDMLHVLMHVLSKENSTL